MAIPCIAAAGAACPSAVASCRRGAWRTRFARARNDDARLEAMARDLDATRKEAGKKGGGRATMLLAFKVVSPALCGGIRIAV